jgi:putative intracellular protease/amidase
MKLLLLLTPKDFRDESIATIKLFLDKWNVPYEIATYGLKDCVGSHGATYKPTVDANKALVSDYDGIVIIDGEGIEGFRMYEYRPLLDLLMKFNANNKIIGAIGNSQKVLARANIINGKKIAIFNDEETKRLVLLFHGIPSENDFELSGNILTVKDSALIQQAIQGILSQLGVF